MLIRVILYVYSDVSKKLSAYIKSKQTLKKTASSFSETLTRVYKIMPQYTSNVVIFFKTIFSNLGYASSNYWMILHDERNRLWRETVMVKISSLFRHLPVGEESQESLRRLIS
jgi:hypothetical protein